MSTILCHSDNHSVSVYDNPAAAFKPVCLHFHRLKIMINAVTLFQLFNLFKIKILLFCT